MPRLRFSLKLLLLGIFVCAGLAAWYAVVYKQHQFRAQELAKLVPQNFTVDIEGEKRILPDRTEYQATPFPSSGSHWSWLLAGRESMPLQKLLVSPNASVPWILAVEIEQQLARRMAEPHARFDLRAVPELEELEIVPKYQQFLPESANALNRLVKLRFFANVFDRRSQELQRVDRQLSNFVRALPHMPQLRELTADSESERLEGSLLAGLLEKAPNLEKLQLAVGELGPEDAAALSRLAELSEVKLCFYEPRVKPYQEFVQAVLQRPKLKTASLLNYPVTKQWRHPFDPNPVPPTANELEYGFIEQEFGQADRTLELRDSPLEILKLKGAPRFLAERCPVLTEIELEAASSQLTLRNCPQLEKVTCNSRMVTLEDCPQLGYFSNSFTQRATLRNVPLLKSMSFEALDELVVKEGVALEDLYLSNYEVDADNAWRGGNSVPLLKEARCILPVIPTLRRLSLHYLTPELLDSLERMKSLPRLPAVELKLNGLDEALLNQFLTTLPLRKLKLWVDDGRPVFNPDQIQKQLAPLAKCESLEELDLYGLSYFFRPPVMGKDGRADESFETMAGRWTLELPASLKVLEVCDFSRKNGDQNLKADDPMVLFLKHKYPQIKIEIY